jgi:excisionase family DNA binding protein
MSPRIIDTTTPARRAPSTPRGSAATSPQRGGRTPTSSRFGANRADDRLLSADEVAELLGMSAYWVREQTRKRKIPFVALGPKVRKYRRSSLQAWLAESEERPR